MSFPKHYTLVKEHDKHFEVHDGRDDKTFHVSKKGIHPANQIRIMKMQKYADGGKVNKLDPDPQRAKDAMKGFDEGQTLSKGWQNLKKAVGVDGDEKPQEKSVAGYAQGGQVRRYVDGTPDGEVGSLEDNLRQAYSIARPLAAPEEQEGPVETAPVNGQPIVVPGTMMPNGLQQEAPPLLNQQAPGAVPEMAAEVPPGQAQVAPPPPTGGSQGDFNNLQNQYLGSIRDELAAQKGMTKEQQAAQASYQTTLAEAHQKFQGYRDNLETSINDLRQKINDGEVNPNHYWESKSTGSKISTALGVILSGIGAGLQHSTTNMAWEALQKNIDRDIQTQKDSLGRKQTMLSDNMRLYGNYVDAENATRIQAGSLLQAELSNIAAKSRDPLLAARAKQAEAEIGIKLFPLKNQLAASQTQQDVRASLSNSAQPVRKEDPALYVEALVPQHNRAEVYKEIKMAQNTKRMSQSILSSFEQAAKENTIAKTGAGLLRTPASVLALHQAMQPTFADLEGTVRQAAMDNTFKNVTPAPGDSAHTVQQKREALYEYLQSKASAPVAKGSGLDLARFDSTRPMQFVETKSMGGQQYQKVQGGWKKVK